MCGIIAVVRRRSRRVPPTADQLLSPLDAARRGLEEAAPRPGSPVPTVLDGLFLAAEQVGTVDRLLRGTPGVLALTGDRSLMSRVAAATALLDGLVLDVDRALDDEAGFATQLDDLQLEAVNAALVRLKDAVWAVGRDRLCAAKAVCELAGADAGPAALEAFTSVQSALSALDRLEVRGRDSAGLHLLVHRHGLDLGSPATITELAARSADPLFSSGSVRVIGDRLSFVYKAAAEIGELGDNTRVLRAAIAGDDLLARALAGEDAETIVLGHTRWASVGIISEPNAHPLNNEELDHVGGPYVTAALNGDVDNFADLKVREGLRIATEITTDAKVIPALVSRRLAAGDELVDGFRSTVAGFHGSVAIAANAAADPGRLLLALKGSGQALYVGTAEDAYIVASEPYGVIEDCDRYLRMDGEATADGENPTESQGQIISLDSGLAGEVDGIGRISYTGQPLPVDEHELVRSEITTRDIDRGHHPHFLLKEISESPTSFRKTLRGKIVEVDGRLTTHLGTDTLPESVRAGLADGRIAKVVAIGQGTAAVAAQSLARAAARRHHGDGPAGRRRAGHRAVRVRAAPRPVRHARVGHLAVGHHDRHEPDGGPRPGTRRPRRLHREPAQQRSHRQVRRCPLHLRRARRGDERRQHQGLLQPGRGRLRTRLRHRRGGAGRFRAHHRRGGSGRRGPCRAAGRAP